jgi:hypothetical protein
MALSSSPVTWNRVGLRRFASGPVTAAGDRYRPARPVPRPASGLRRPCSGNQEPSPPSKRPASAIKCVRCRCLATEGFSSGSLTSSARRWDCGQAWLRGEPARRFARSSGCPQRWRAARPAAPPDRSFARGCSTPGRGRSRPGDCSATSPRAPTAGARQRCGRVHDPSWKRETGTPRTASRKPSDQQFRSRGLLRNTDDHRQ